MTCGNIAKAETACYTAAAGNRQKYTAVYML